MRKIKGCGNESCEAHKKKITYKELEAFCSNAEVRWFMCAKIVIHSCQTILRNTV